MGNYRAKIATENVMKMKHNMMMMVTMMKVAAAMFSHHVQVPDS